MAVSLDKRSGKLRRLAQAQATFRHLAALVAWRQRVADLGPAGVTPAGATVGGLVSTGARAEPALAATLLFGFDAVAYWGVAGTGRTAFVASPRCSRCCLAAPIAAGNASGRAPNKCGPKN